ncbi:hypothetical protein P7H38_09615 [Lactococcus raffinolactis]|uniref:hypothetical protein n=1 Tax=Pseudolactococcus raffinolactis TaxID=1366 RepID=UPI002891E3F0|nr:hypothetical protein [Lactococcus raffinolactis]MDT2766932.1 hypothetical protein [Lactococcus raffinolactis]MDT2790130.1 hypothetical protein [Lactococcus raffinolactis]
MTKIINRKLLILICAIALVFLGMGIRTSADALPSNQTSVELKVTNNGTPVIHTSYNAMNIDRAYQEIKNGKIGLKARNSAAWILATQNTNSENGAGVITLSNGQKIGQGITHTDEEMGSIISGLMNVDNLSLISEINQSNTTIPFLNPDHVIYKFTNKRGLAKADIEQGYTLILDNNNNFVKLSKIENSSEKVVIDLANIDNKIKFTTDSKLKTLTTNFGQYVVGTNQKISFNLSINKDMWQQAGTVNLVLPPQSNLSFDSIEVLDGNDAATVVTNPTLNDTMVFNSSEPVIAATIALNETQSNILLRVTVHVNLEGNNVSSNKPIHTSLQAVSVNKDGSSNIVSTPNLNITGINFAMTKKNATEFAQGGEFALAKSKGTTYEVYGKNNKWHQVDDLNQVQTSDTLVLEGGHRYILGGEQPAKIPLNVLRFNFNEKRSKEINKSLIQVFGLAQGGNYFLYRIDTANKLSSTNRMFKFSIFSRSYFSPDNALMVDSSINNPTNPLIGLSGQIPDYAAGNNEYSNLTLDGSRQEWKVEQIYIVATISIMVIIILVVVILIVRHRGL